MRGTPQSKPVMQVPLLDLKQQYRPLAADIQAAITAVCDSQHFILGAEVKKLEADVAAYSQCRFGIGVSSGTDALLLALMALGIGAGDAVITSPFTFFATAGTIARTGARPLFCDIDPATFNLSPAAVTEFLAAQCERRDGALLHRASGSRVRALMPVHLYGRIADMQPLLQSARHYGLKVIEDAAQAIGAADAAGRRAGSFGEVGCLSFFPTKNLGAFGDAGMCVTGDATLAERMEILRVHGGRPKYYHASSAAISVSMSCRPPCSTSSCRTSRRGARRGGATPLITMRRSFARSQGTPFRRRERCRAGGTSTIST